MHGPPVGIPTIVGDCLICGSGAADVILDDLRDIENGVAGDYAIARCRDCSGVYLRRRPLPAALGRCYPETYQTHVAGRSNFMRRLFKIRFAIRSQLVRQHVPAIERACIVEIGCGGADYLAYLAERFPGANLVGVDPFAPADLVLPAGSRVEVFRTEFKDLPATVHPDVVILHETLEHVPEPLATLTEIKTRAPHAIVVGTVPNWRSLGRAVFSRYWSGLQVPRHQVFFDPPSLAQLLDRAGYRVARISPTFDPGELSVSLCNWICQSLRLKSIPRHAWFFLPLTIAAAPIALIQNIVGWGGAMAFVAIPDQAATSSACASATS
jgi:SAM-dependent methyltransferase